MQPRTRAELAKLAPHEVPRFKGEGLAFLTLTILVGIGAMNTGNNLLYLILAMMLAFVIVSGVLAISTLNGVHGVRRPPARAYAGVPVQGELVLRNEKRRVSSFGLEITDKALSGATVMMRFVPHLGPRAELRMKATYRFERRGVARLVTLRIATRFPFGFLERGRRQRLETEVLVYPPIERVDLRAVERALGDGGEPAHRKGPGDELHAVRPYVEGDALRHVAWKHSARSTELMVRDFEAPAFRRSTVVLDLSEAATLERTASGHDEEIERAISRAAGLVEALLERGFAVRLVSHGVELGHGTGPEHLERALELLALLDPYGPTLAPCPRVTRGRTEGPPLRVRPGAAVEALA